MNKSASARVVTEDAAPSMSKDVTATPPVGNTGFCENVTTPAELIAIESASPTEPI